MAAAAPIPYMSSSGLPTTRGCWGHGEYLLSGLDHHPWTIPGNLAIALHPDLEYVLVQAGPERYLLAEGLLESVQKELGASGWKVLARFPGRRLEGLKYRHPLVNRECPIILADHVTLEQGTGCVHTAPGHGQEDYDVGRLYGLEVFSPVDEQGRFTQEAGEFSGLRYDQGNAAVIKALEREKALLKVGQLEHQYPHCWRCKDPIIFRATEQWFASVDGFREEALAAIRRVQWIPPWGEERLYNMVRERQDWCISRQRVWGVPLPIFYCAGCREPIMEERTLQAVAQLFAREGSDAWFVREAEEILPEGYTCPRCGHGTFIKEKDTMDVWFDSGSSHLAVCDNRPDLHWPADLYLEGSDQYRGWFQSSLLTSVANRGEPPIPSRPQPRLGGGRRGEEDVQVPGQRHRPRRGDPQLRRRHPAPLGLLGGFYQRHASLPGNFEAADGDLPQDPQYLPLPVEQLLRF